MKSNFVKQDFDAMNIEKINEYVDLLLKREVEDYSDFIKWIEDREEFENTISEDLTRAHVDFTCNTQDKKIEEKYLYIIREISPFLSKKEQELDKKFLENKNLNTLDDFQYGIYIKKKKASFDLFCEKNIPLQTKCQELVQRYSKIASSLTIKHNEEEITMKHAANLLESKDRVLREQIWKKIALKRKEKRDEIDNIFDEMVKIRHKIAKNAGFDNYVDYMFKAKYRFDYTAKDCERFHESIKNNMVPALKNIFSKKSEKLHITNLKPWDLGVNPYTEKVIKTFDDIEVFVKKVREIFADVLEEFGTMFDELIKNDNLDLLNRKGKAPGGYQTIFSLSKQPFIFANMLGTVKDLGTMLHEGGHAFHYISARDNFPFLRATSEFNEVASMAMEFFGLENENNRIFSEDEKKRVLIKHFEGVIRLFSWVAKVDAFQLWVYKNPDSGVNKRREYWYSLEKRFDTGVVDYTDVEYFREINWHGQHHIFKAPFYYIEYAIAELGALQLWVNYKDNPESTIKQYREALECGGRLSIPKLYEKAGIKFDFSDEMVKKLAQRCTEKLNELYKQV